MLGVLQNVHLDRIEILRESRFFNRPILIYYNSALNNRPQYEAHGNKYRVCGVYSPEPRPEVYGVRLNFNISKFAYSFLWKIPGLKKEKEFYRGKVWLERCKGKFVFHFPSSTFRKASLDTPFGFRKETFN